jgi:hypothetical protein
MKKLFKATPMKKLLLASSILAISSTAIAANTSVLLDTAVTDTLTVTAKYVTPIKVALDTSTINFGDVWTDSIIDTEAVVATVTGEIGETFTYSVVTDGTLAQLTGNITGTTVDFVTSDTTQALTFNVGLDTSSATTAGSISEIVTVEVVYDAIADTRKDHADDAPAT